LKFKRYPNEKIEREKERKSDVVIKRYLENSKEIDLMEVKTYIKKNEKLSYVNIFNDIEKLTQTLEFYGEEFNEKKGYFLLAFREKVLNVNYKSFRNKAFSEFLKDDSSKIYNFEAEGKKFKTRIIRSVKTAFLSEKNEFSAHKNQIRIIMFELIK
jgi:replicative DNA helicase